MRLSYFHVRNQIPDRRRNSGMPLDKPLASIPARRHNQVPNSTGRSEIQATGFMRRSECRSRIQKIQIGARIQMTKPNRDTTPNLPGIAAPVGRPKTNPLTRDEQLALAGKKWREKVRRITVSLPPGAWEILEQKTRPGETTTQAIVRLILAEPTKKKRLR